MKREILFRGFHKCKEGKEKAFFDGKWHKGKWVEGCYFVAKDKNFNILHYISEIKGEHMFEVFPETVGQYIGLIDKNGAMVFEGDVVKDTADNDVLLAVEGSTPFGFDFRYISDDEDDAYVTAFDIGIDDDMKYLTSAVITGKIYDNPELLVQE